MDFTALLKLIGPTLVSLLSSTATELKTPTPTSDTVRRPSQAIMHLQALLNVVMNPDPPLVEDGWLGPKTEAAIEAGIVRLKSLGIG